MGKKQKKGSIDKNEEKEYKDNDKENEALMKAFNISNFDTTKNKSHVESDLSGVFKGIQVKRVYRQYMNRRGGFNKNKMRQPDKRGNEKN